MLRPIAGTPHAFYTTCLCGTDFRVSRTTLVKHRENDTAPRCQSCTNRLRAKKCRGKRGHSRTNRARVPRAERKQCLCCEGLSWRRPRRGLCDCGGRFQAEPAVTLQDILSAPRDAARVYPIGGI